jgi:NAD+ kinase
MPAGATTDGTIGIVEGARASTLAAAVEDHGGTAVVDAPASFAEAGVPVVVAGGEAAVYECVRVRVDAPVLAVDGGAGLRGVPRSDAAAAIERVLADDFSTVARRTLAVSTTGDHESRALADVTCITTEPARITEYGLHTPDGDVAQFRADGIVLATPVGSHGYARAAGSHVLAPNTGVLAAVPIAPFATDAADWVLPDASVTVSVERDESAVSLRVDDEAAATLAHGDRVTVTPDDPIELVVTPESVGPWSTALEKH